MDTINPLMILALVFGISFIVIMIVLALKFPEPTPFQYNVFRIVLSLAAAGVAAMLPGFIHLETEPGFGVLIQAGGALAIFVLVYFYNPARLISPEKDNVFKGPQVAAICYRINNDDVQFYLVRTTGGRWTFPKGKVEDGEEEWFAAKREAFEEAGVQGSICHQAIATYLHEKKEWKNTGREIKVCAYLLKVEKTQAPKEIHREPTWFSALEAEDALCDNRSFKYGDGFREVIRVAIENVGNKA